MRKCKPKVPGQMPQRLEMQLTQLLVKQPRQIERLMTLCLKLNIHSVHDSLLSIDGLPRVWWEPDLNEGGTKNERTYKVWGKETLDDGEWQYPTNALHRFFKVTVEMP